MAPLSTRILPRSQSARCMNDSFAQDDPQFENIYMRHLEQT